MNAVVGEETGRWKRKYYQSLEELERKEAHWGGVEELLYQNLSRLSLAAYGHDTSLDGHLDRLRQALRDRTAGNRISELTERVHQAATQLQTSRERKAAAASPRRVLCELLTQLDLPQSLHGRRRRILDKLEAAGDDVKPDRLVADAGKLVAQALALAAEGATDGNGQGGTNGKRSLLGRLLSGSEAAPAGEPSTPASTAALSRLIGALGSIDDLLPGLGELEARAQATTDQAAIDAIADDLALGLCQALQGTADRATTPHHADIEQVLLALLERLELPETQRDEVDALTAQLDRGLAPDEVPVVVATVADLVSTLRAQIQEERARMQRFLEDITARLQTLDDFLEITDRSRLQSLDDSRTLHTSVAAEMDGLQAEARHAGELDNLRRSVELRVDVIREHMATFQDHSERRSREAEAEIGRLGGELEGTRKEAGELRVRLQEAQTRAMRDGLTGLYNRTTLDDRMRTEEARWRRYGEPVSLLLWDVDHFKAINDTYGHQAGDKVLKAVASVLRRNTRESDFVARYGGEEFVVLLPSTVIDDAVIIAEKLRATVQTAGFKYRGEPVVVTASCGVSDFKGEENASDSLRRADKALYAAKAAGRNRIHKAD